MLARWKKINAALRQCFAQSGNNLRMDTSSEHEQQVDVLLQCLEPIQLVTQKLQQKHMKLSMVWKLLNALVTDILPSL